MAISIATDNRISLTRTYFIHAMPGTGKTIFERMLQYFGIAVSDTDGISRIIDPSYFDDRPWILKDEKSLERVRDVSNRTADVVYRLLSLGNPPIVLSNLWGATYSALELKLRSAVPPGEYQLSANDEASYINVSRHMGVLVTEDWRRPLPERLPLGLSVRRTSVDETMALIAARGGRVLPAPVLRQWLKAINKKSAFRHIVWLCPPDDYEAVVKRAGLPEEGDDVQIKQLDCLETGVYRCSVTQLSRKVGVPDTTSHYFVHRSRTVYLSDVFRLDYPGGSRGHRDFSEWAFARQLTGSV